MPPPWSVTTTSTVNGLPAAREASGMSISTLGGMAIPSVTLAGTVVAKLSFSSR